MKKYILEYQLINNFVSHIRYFTLKKNLDNYIKKLPKKLTNFDVFFVDSDKNNYNFKIKEKYIKKEYKEIILK